MLVRASVREVRAAERRLVLRAGDTLTYDKLVLATGARTLPAFDQAITFGEQGSGERPKFLHPAAGPEKHHYALGRAGESSPGTSCTGMRMRAGAAGSVRAWS